METGEQENIANDEDEKGGKIYGKYVEDNKSGIITRIRMENSLKPFYQSV